MNILTLAMLITFQTTYKTALKNILKKSGKRLKRITSSAFSKIVYWSKAVWEGLKRLALFNLSEAGAWLNSEAQIEGRGDETWT